MPFKEHTIIEQVIEAVSNFDEIIIVANEPEAYEVFGYEVIQDVYKGKGPLAGIHVGLSRALHDDVLIVACDMPRITPQMTEILYAYNEPYDALVSYDGDEIHPLFSMYNKRCLPEIERHLKEDLLKLKLFLKEVNTVILNWQDHLDIEDPRVYFKNINTPVDYKALLRTSDKNEQHIICIVGASNSGKTTLIQMLIPKINEKGYTVGTIKHSHHTDLVATNKDNTKHYQAGANKTMLVGQNNITTIQRVEEEVSLKQLVKQFKDVDVLIIEGYKKANYPKLEIVRSQVSSEPMCNTNELKAIISDTTNKAWQCPTIALENVDAIVEFILNQNQ